jgi:pimeloyl-ACP methyl ester carboxylesterase
VRAALTWSLAGLVLFALAACGGTNTTASSSPSAAPSQAAVTTSPSPTWTPTMSPAPIPVVKPGQKPPPFSELKAMFAYDKTEPFALREIPNLEQTEDGVTYRCVTFQSGGELASGFLALPKGDGPFPVVVTAPGLGEGGDTSQGSFFVPQGYALLALDEPSLAFSLADAQGAIANYVQYGIQERRALDLLETMPEIDARRIGFMGFSNGAIVGALLAGVDERVKAYVLMGVPLLDDEEFKDVAPGKAAWERYVAQMAALDLAAYVGHNKGAAFLFVNGDRDYRAMRSGKALMAVAPKPRDWYVFAGSHRGPETVAVGRKMDKYWLDWMVKQL